MFRNVQDSPQNGEGGESHWRAIFLQAEGTGLGWPHKADTPRGLQRR